MTVDTDDNPADRRSGDAAPLRLSHPAELLAAIPALLGFRPQDSLVVVCLGGPSGRRVQLTIRVDLPAAVDERRWPVSSCLSSLKVARSRCCSR